MNRLELIYLGNQLSGHGINPTSVEILGERLKEDFQVIRASSKSNKWLRLLDMWWTIIKGRKADFLLIDTYSTSAFVFAWTSALLAKKMGLKYIPILHGGALPERARKSPRKLTRYLKSAHAVVCPSSYLEKEMKKVINLNYQVIPNAIELTDYPFLLREGFDSSGPRMLWVRAFDKIYNPTLAIRLLKALTEMGYSQACLCMIGPDKDGTLAEVKELAQQLDLTEKVKITGRLSRDEWVKLSCDYDVFINTTNVDNTPVSILESLALGLPVVSSRVGGIPYILNSGEDSLLAKAGSVESFTEAIIKLYDKAFYKEVSLKGRALAESYSWAQIRSAWLNILK